MEKGKYRAVVCKNFGGGNFYFDNKEDAIDFLLDKWFSPSVWDVRLFDTESKKEIDISETIKAAGDRPVYC